MGYRRERKRILAQGMAPIFARILVSCIILVIVVVFTNVIQLRADTSFLVEEKSLSNSWRSGWSTQGSLSG